MSEIQVGQINSTDGSTAITTGADGYVSFAKTQIGGRKNIILNGDMRIAQRGTSGTSTADVYLIDRFAVGHGSPVNAMTVEQSTDAPNNFKNSLKITAGTGASASTTGYALLRQAIEGQNMSHFGFGTSAATPITLSFWVKSSLTGTFGVSTRNQAGNRAYGGTYVINSADTWEYKTVAIPADTSGTWPTDNGIGIQILWDLGAGSNYDIAAGSWTDGSNMFGVEGTVKLTETTGATFYITGVQLEVGTVATPFEHRSYGEELALCQRYFQYISSDNRVPAFVGGGSTTNVLTQNLLIKPMRAQPSLSVSGAMSFDAYYRAGYTQSSANFQRNSGTTTMVVANAGNFSGMSSQDPGGLYNANISIDAEL